jgi:hypothetical protein
VRQTFPLHARVLLFVVVILVAPVTVSAQVGGVIVDAARRPVQSATIRSGDRAGNSRGRYRTRLAGLMSCSRPKHSQ